MSILAKFYTTLVQFLESSDPRVADYFLLQSPLQPTLIVLLYCVFTFKLGRLLMNNRPPFNLKKLLVAYNILQVFLNAVLFTTGLFYFHDRVSIWCTPVDYSIDWYAILLLKLHYSYFLLKFLDFSDTIFFVLRKKYDHISFLHVYHHIGILVVAWISNKYFPGGHGIFVLLPNTLIHTIMYFYYLLTVVNSAYKRKIWWKKYLTQLQIVQHYFIFVVFFFALVNADCSYPKIWTAIFLFNVALMIGLFTRFYSRNYLRNPKLKASVANV